VSQYRITDGDTTLGGYWITRKKGDIIPPLPSIDISIGKRGPGVSLVAVVNSTEGGYWVTGKKGVKPPSSLYRRFNWEGGDRQSRFELNKCYGIAAKRGKLRFPLWNLSQKK